MILSHMSSRVICTHGSFFQALQQLLLNRLVDLSRDQRLVLFIVVVVILVFSCQFLCPNVT